MTTDITPAMRAALDQARATVQQLTDWAHRDRHHDEQHDAEVVTLLNSLTDQQLADALMTAAWTISALVPATCESDEL